MTDGIHTSVCIIGIGHQDKSSLDCAQLDIIDLFTKNRDSSQ
jgi:hypothetical protein